MNDSAPHDRDSLDAALDAAIDRLTAVDDMEAAARARVHQRLRTDGTVDAIDSTATRRLWPRWAAATAFVGLVGVLFVTWLARRDTNPPPREVATSEHAAAPAPRMAPSLAPRPAPATTASNAARPQPTHVVARRARTLRTSPRPATPSSQERMADFLRVVRALPPDVWERLDAAGPPTVAAIDLEEAPGIEPLTIEQLPGSDWTLDTSERPDGSTSTPYTPPGGLR